VTIMTEWGATPFAYTLTKCPGNIYVLWQEWEFGIGGRKAAKIFNESQRGIVKFNYCLRKPFWHLVTKMIRLGYCSATAIDKIYSNVYSNGLSTTKKLQKNKTRCQTRRTCRIEILNKLFFTLMILLLLLILDILYFGQCIFV
jgi:hypothetical protein